MSPNSNIFSSILIILAIKTMKKINPLNMAINILIASIILSLAMNKSSLSSWIPFITIITFSAGMMILFIYVSSMSPNEKSKKTPTSWILILLGMILKPPKPEKESKKSSMKMFSNQLMLMLMTMTLIITILTISQQSFNPHQSMNSTF